MSSVPGRLVVVALAIVPLQMSARAEEQMLVSPMRLTTSQQFSKAGEAYFSPDGEWIIFQAVPSGIETADSSPRYSMYVAPLVFGDGDRVTGIGEPIEISHPGSANTCGWFHPTLPGVVMFGSTLDRPPAEHEEAGYSRERSRYAWAFPREMDIVTRTVPEIVRDVVTEPGLRESLLARPDLDQAVPLWERDGYDAECSWSPDGRFVLYTAVDPETRDADIYLREMATGRTIPLVVEPGYDGGPFFSPDGTRICYRSDRQENNLLQLYVADLELDRRGVPVRVSSEAQLTSNEHVNWAPYWHPSGNLLIYTTSQVSHLNYEVFAIESRPGAEGALPRPIRVTSADGFDGLPVFSPDGSLMMWTSQRDDDGGDRSSQLWLARLSDRLPVSASTLHSASAGAGALAPDDAPVAAAMARLSPAARRFDEHVTTLASAWMAGRKPGTPGIALAERYIADTLLGLGLEPLFPGDAGNGGADSFFQTFEIRQHGSDDIFDVRNVGAILPGRGELADRFVVIGAHHDHLGDGQYGSMEGPGEIHEGADDNASGVSALLLLARQLRDRAEESPDDTDLRSVIFVTFTSEEMGLNGSRHFAQNPPVPLERCDLMLNFDMIGRITEGRVSVAGLGSGDGLNGLLDSVLSAGPLEVVRPDGLSARSDHAAFYDEQVPVLFMSITPFHPDYHTPGDESWKINRHGAALAVDLAERIVMEVAGHPRPLEFTEVEHYDRGPSVSMGKIKVRFGIMPGNYNDTEPGVQVQRVSPDTSAEKGGVLDGDRLMRWNGELIESIPAWMEQMARHAPGDVVRVVVMRDGEPVELLITLLPSRRAEPEPEED